MSVARRVLRDDRPERPTTRRLAVAKTLLLVVAVIAAYVMSLKPVDILFLVGAAFSLAASAFFPALVCRVFWKRANKLGAILGMVAGVGICMYYMYMTYPFFRVNAPLWWDIISNPISAGIFGIPAGFIGRHHRQPDLSCAAGGCPGAGRPRTPSGPQAGKLIRTPSEVDAKPAQAGFALLTGWRCWFILARSFRRSGRAA